MDNHHIYSVERLKRFFIVVLNTLGLASELVNESSLFPEEQQARRLVAEANKKSGRISNGFQTEVVDGERSNIEDAIKLYNDAAEIFKMAKKWAAAGNCLFRAAILNLCLENKLEASQKFWEASNCYREVDSELSIFYLKQALAIRKEMRRLNTPTQTHTGMADGVKFQEEDDDLSFSNDIPARRLLAKAHKKSPGKLIRCLSGVFGDGSSKTDDVIESYCKAANLFVMAEKWGEAGNCIAKAANLSLGSDNKLDTAEKFRDASNCFYQVDPTRSVDCLKKAATIQKKMGRFTEAAKTYSEIAKIYEHDLRDFDRAIVHYQKAANYYQGWLFDVEDCLLEVARLTAFMENYQKAAQIFEQVADRRAKEKLLKLGAREIYIKATLCHMCVDPSKAQHALASYLNFFPFLKGSLRYLLMKKLLNSMEASDVDAFTEALRKYDNITRLDPWTTAVLLTVKRSIGKSPSVDETSSASFGSFASFSTRLGWPKCLQNQPINR